MPGPVQPIQAHAAADLRFIRDAVARAAEFTAVPGWGGVQIGAMTMKARRSGTPPSSAAPAYRFALA